MLPQSTLAKIIPPRGPVDSPFVIVGEAPGKQEVKEGKPFVGPSGAVLNAALDQYAKDAYPDPFVINVVPHMINVDKDPSVLAEIALKYRSALIAEIEKHPRKVILALGSVALMALTGDTSLKITQRRGELFQSDLSERGIVASVHPAYLLRGNGSLRQFKADVAYAVDLANGEEPIVFTPPTWELVDTPEKAAALVQLINNHDGIVASDIETSGFSHRMDHILLSGFTIDGKHVYIVPGKKTDIPAEQNQTKNIQGIFDNPKSAFTWHNGKFDIKFFHHIGMPFARVDEDTMLMSYALDEKRGIHDLETVAADWLKSPSWKKVLDQYKKKNESYDVIPRAVLEKYAAYDIANTYNLAVVLRDKVRADRLSEKLYTETLIPGSAFLAKVEKTGLFVDKELVKQNSFEMQAEADKYANELKEMAEKVAPGKYTDKMCNSPKQLTELLFVDYKIKAKVRSTNAKALNELSGHPVVRTLLTYRKINKGLSTYVTPMSENVADDGRVHTSYLLHGTATGRLASRDPNVQNIPRDPKLRGQFIPRPGYVYLEVDLNQAELRSLACLSGCPVLGAIYTSSNGPGLHEEVRATIFGHPEQWTDSQLSGFFARWFTNDVQRVLDEQKMRAKNVNFGIIYGITSAGLSEQIQDTPAEAAKYLNAWAKKFPTAWQFIQNCRMAPIRGQNLTTVFGHRKRFTIVSPETLQETQNEAANFPHQSSASTITLHGGMRIHDTLVDEYDSYICNLVHDSLLIEVPFVRKTIEAVAEYAIDALQQVPKDYGLTRIPFVADAKVGLRWGTMTSLPKFFKEHNM